MKEKIINIILEQTFRFLGHGGLHRAFVFYNLIAIVCIMYTVSRIKDIVRSIVRRNK